MTPRVLAVVLSIALGAAGFAAAQFRRADYIDLSIRLSELRKIRVSFNPAGEPSHLIVRLTDDELCRCPKGEREGRQRQSGSNN